MMFVIFKQPRTGSSTLAEMINDTPGAFCKHEVLNGWDKSSSPQDFISEIISRSSNKVVGFTINPKKYDINPDFFDMSGEKKVFHLERMNSFEHTISHIVSKIVRSYPNNRQDKAASTVLSFVNSRPCIDKKAFEKQYAWEKRATVAIGRFASKFAKRHGLSVVHLAYERIYEDGSDLDVLDRHLGIKIDRTRAAPLNKLLPDPREWVANYIELQEIADKLAKSYR